MHCDGNKAEVGQTIRRPLFETVRNPEMVYKRHQL